jgi:phosphoserine aminotransferase
LHVCVNETVHGFKIGEDNFPWDKFPKDLVIVGDMSSCVATEKINWDRYQVIYAGAQKNLGPCGCTVIIVKNSLLGQAEADVPVMCDWNLFESSPGQYYNTPPCWTIYVTGLNCSYQNAQGGIEYYDKLADERSKMLYAIVDASNGFYDCKVDVKFRSRMNICFRINGADKDMEAKFIKEAEAVKIINTGGHPANPGIRISVYNAMPTQGVVDLCAYMKRF